MNMDAARMNARTQVFSIGLLNWKSMSSIAVLCILLGASFMAASPTGGIVFAGAVSAGLLGLLGSTVARARVVLTDSTIRIGVLPYRVTLPYSELLSDQAHQVADGDAVRLKWRKNGIGLPGLCVGHFTTRYGRPVFAAVSGSRNRVLIPTRRDFDLLVTVEDAAKLIAEVRRRQHGCARVGGR
ncbi:hypothetical protein [Stenotrophomonas chelatiphaga]|uniref:hypothetical protein n=1 Tax=Stenotrophomonas chelatiphaga TaxID=517011 RepID=UPI0028A2136D|nr:hypothetical protein [Stenotrophomonas chelatiphaga]